MPGVPASESDRIHCTRTIAFWLLLTGIALLLPASTRAQISPGPLSKAHSSQNGSTHCSSCHVFGAATPTFKCLDCHKEVAEALANKHGYHFRLKMQNPSGKDCVRCHLEHNGENFQLIHWEHSEKKNFDHRSAGYVLEGKHAALACQQCHTPAHMLPALQSLIQLKDLSKSLFGQSPSCSPCHGDPHKGQLGSDCANCHNMETWKSAQAFDHSKTRYALTGLHNKVACEKCHRSDTPGGPARYKDLKFDTCSACHSDPHRSEFKKTCETCHTTRSWKTLLPGFDFDHAKTKYPLMGKHAQVPCSACHFNGEFKKEIAFVACKDCHSSDPHKGQFHARPQKGECAECHTVEGWKPSLFTIREHDTTRYPLKGKHATVACAECHTPPGKEALYKIKFSSCTDCHKDAHDMQFATAPYKNTCESCHTVQDWHRSSYTIAKHRDSRFPLQGAHAAVPCSDCHKTGLGGRTDKILPFQFEDRTCAACHTDPHKGEFNNQMARKRADGSPSGCEACHSVQSWSDISGFDHAKTKYPLLGAHRTVKCANCHKPTSASPSRFEGTPTQCEACHKDVHDGQFLAKDNQTNCFDCHNSVGWTPSTFDHGTRTRFPLAGGHANVPCARCHTQTRTAGNKEIVVYKKAPSKCADCHGNTATPSPP
jgi:hypothetical protein